MSYVEVGDYVVWNGEKFIVELKVGSGGLIVKSTERDFKTCVSKLSVTRVSKIEIPAPEPRIPYEKYHDSFSRYNQQKCKWEFFLVGERVKILLYGSKFLNGYGIYDHHVGKIVEIKQVVKGPNDVAWRIYVQNPLWHYELPDKDPTIMEFLDYEILKIEN